MINSIKFNKKERCTSLDISNMVFGKVPPQSKELEEAVLGAILLEKQAFDVAAEFLKPECFYVDAHQKIFSAMCRLSQKSQPIDLLTTVEELRKTEELNYVGGPHYVTKITNSVVSAANIESHARIILQKFIQRELIRISGETINDAYEDSTDVFELLDDVDRKHTSLNMGHLQKSYSTILSAVSKSINRIEELKAKGSDLTGITTGFKSIDRITHGWQDTDLIILAARPSVGKTALALNFARNAGIPVAFFSMEMGEQQLTNRLLSAESEVWLEKISTGKMEDYEMKQLYSKGVDPLSKMKIFIDDSPGLTLLEIKSKARNLKRKEGIGLIIIDYLQLMSGQDNKGNREREISTISRGLKTLAKELKIPIIALSQLSRKTEERKGDGKIPQLSDLRESGAIEQDADMVMFLYRPEYYDITANEMGESNKGETYVKIAKHRNGSLDTIKLKALLHIQKFIEHDGASDFSSQFPVKSNFRPINNNTEEDAF